MELALSFGKSLLNERASASAAAGLRAYSGFPGSAFAPGAPDAPGRCAPIGPCWPRPGAFQGGHHRRCFRDATDNVKEALRDGWKERLTEPIAWTTAHLQRAAVSSMGTRRV
jgi:hypothetical protein